MDRKQFGEKIRYFRKQKGLTQGQLAEMIGVSQVTIAHYERGNRFPKGTKLALLASVLNVSVDSLMGLEVKEEAESQGLYSIDELIELLHSDSMERSWVYLRHWQLSRKYDSMGVFRDILIPLLERVGDLWQEKKIYISQEHIITDKVKLLIDRLVREEMEEKHILPDRERKWMGLCAPGEQHELVLFMISQLMRLSGWDVNYLGKDIPLNDLKKMVRRYKPDILVFSITMKNHGKILKEYLEGLSVFLKRSRIIVGGRGWIGGTGEGPSAEAEYVDSLDQYFSLIGEGKK